MGKLVRMTLEAVEIGQARVDPLQQVSLVLVKRNTEENPKGHKGKWAIGYSSLAVCFSTFCLLLPLDFDTEPCKTRASVFTVCVKIVQAESRNGAHQTFGHRQSTSGGSGLSIAAPSQAHKPPIPWPSVQQTNIFLVHLTPSHPET